MYGVSLFSDAAMVIDGINIAGGIETTTTFATFEEALAFEEAVHNAGFNYLYGSNGVVHFSNVIGGTGQYGLSAVNTTGVAQTANTTAVTVSGLEADAGLNIVDGGVTVGVAAAQLAGAVMLGAGLGYNSYQNYPEFWSALSEGLADGIGGNEVMPVILRATDQGGIKGYVRKTDVDTILDNLYDLTKMNPETVLDPDVHGGDVDFIATTNHEMLNSAIVDSLVHNPGDPVTPPARGDATYNRAHDYYYQTYPGAEAPNYMKCTSQIYDYYGQRMTGLRCEVGYVEPQTVNVTLETGPDGRTYIRTGVSVNGKFADVADNYYSDGTFYQTIQRTNSLSSTLYGGIWNTTSGTTSATQAGGLKTTVDCNPAVRYNNQTTKEDDRRNFWQKFANWLAKGFLKHIYNPITKINVHELYLPIELPYVSPQTDVDDSPQVQTEVQTGTETQTILDHLVETLTTVIGQYFWIQTPSDPIGETPEPVAPTPVFDGPGLWAIYNPTKAQINALGAYLWSSNVIDIIEKFFSNSPLEAIISLHMIYCTPTTGTSQNIILGYLDSGVSAKTVTEQYESIDCGTVFIGEHFGDARDYVNTTVEAYLPFIGIRTLNTADIIGSSVNIKYTIDVLTGTVLCQIFITKSGLTQCLYQYEGNCAVQIPLTSADRSRLVSGMVSSLASAVALGAAGGPVGAVAGAVGGAINGLSHGTTIERSGGLSGNSGAMAIKTPYILITRKKANQMGNYYDKMGAAACYTAKLSTLRGLTVVRSVVLDGIDCSDTERDMIEAALKSGIII